MINECLGLRDVSRKQSRADALVRLLQECERLLEAGDSQPLAAADPGVGSADTTHW